MLTHPPFWTVSWPIDTVTNEAPTYIRLLCQSTYTRHMPDVVNALKTVGHCGASTVKNDINTVQFLAQTDRFMS